MPNGGRHMPKTSETKRHSPTLLRALLACRGREWAVVRLVGFRGRRARGDHTQEPQDSALGNGLLWLRSMSLSPTLPSSSYQLQSWDSRAKERGPLVFRTLIHLVYLNDSRPIPHTSLSHQFTKKAKRKVWPQENRTPVLLFPDSCLIPWPRSPLQATQVGSSPNDWKTKASSPAQQELITENLPQARHGAVHLTPIISINPHHNPTR